MGPATTASPLRSGPYCTQVFVVRWLSAAPVRAWTARSTAMPAAATLPAEECPCDQRFRAQQTCAPPRCCPADRAGAFVLSFLTGGHSRPRSTECFADLRQNSKNFRTDPTTEWAFIT